MKSWLRVIGGTQCENKIENFTINGETPNLGKCKVTKEGENTCHEHQIPMEGFTKYSIEYTRTKTYNLNEDFYIGFRAKYIVNKLRVSLIYPDDLDVIFTCRRV